MEGGEIREYKKYTVILPEVCKRAFRDPHQDWKKNLVGVKGCINYCVAARSLYYILLFTEKSKDFTPVRASVSTIMYMDKTTSENPMNALNMAQMNFQNQKATS